MAVPAAAELAGRAPFGAASVPSVRARSARLSVAGVRYGVAFLLVLFLVAFPKGGVKVGEVPITWGYLALAIPLLAFAGGLLNGAPLRVTRVRLLPLAALVPFQFLVWTSLMINGFDGAGFTVSLLVTFFVLPVTFLLAIGLPLEGMDLDRVLRWVRNAMLFAAAYGIALFGYVLATGEFVEIPLLTSNLADFGTLGDKHNNRGGIWKLISTYNNGNLYGVSILLLLPVFSQVERRPWARGIVKLSLLLTLSRTVWIGLVLWEVLERLYVSRLSVRRLLGLVVALAAAGAAIVTALVVLLEREISFLFARDLGGREGLELLADATILPSQPFTTLPEIVYFGVIQEFGMVGLLFFLIAMAAPPLLLVFGAVPHPGSEWKRALGAGLALYLVICMVDGGTLFIPVAAFFWFVVALLVGEKVPALHRRPPHVPREASALPGRAA
jgi:hypothetical protein